MIDISDHDRAANGLLLEMTLQAKCLIPLVQQTLVQ